jgi:hypothetical protein
VRVAGIRDAGEVRLSGPLIDNCPIGLLVEDSADAAGGQRAVRVGRLDARFNQTAVLLRNAIGVHVVQSFIANRRVAGIHLDPASAGNRLRKNFIRAHPDGAASIDVIDEGVGNCWRGNRFDTGSVVQGSCP